MTEVSFHFNVADKLGYACRLLRKTVAGNHRVGVVGEPELLRALDASLWSFSQLDFIAHCTTSAPAPVVAASPVVLAGDCASFEHGQVLLQLSPQVPTGFERFERLIELVGADEADRALARQRWRHYADRGYTMKSHDSAKARGQQGHGH